MSHPTLQLKDGFESRSPELREDVQRLQGMLQKAGFDLDADGLFGTGTESAVKQFQRSQGLLADGIVGPKTWKALSEFKQTGDIIPPETIHIENVLPGFRGDLKWVHEREGHAGRTYWPGGASGVTLDPGVDLGHAKPSLIQAAYQNLLSVEEYAAVKSVLGFKGKSARQALAGNPLLRSIRISRHQADDIFQYAAQPYWQAICRRFPALTESDTPGCVQTVMLSLSYNRGAGNRGLNVLETPFREKNWRAAADCIGKMQQDHTLEGIRKRRRMEADLIRSTLSN